MKAAWILAGLLLSGCSTLSIQGGCNKERCNWDVRGENLSPREMADLPGSLHYIRQAMGETCGKH